MSDGHDLCRTGQHALAAFQTVGIQIAPLLSPTDVGRQLHRAYAGAALALHLAGLRHVDVREGFGQRSFLRRHPAGDGPHRAEGAPGSRRIDEVQHDAYHSGHNDDGPEHASYGAPHGPSALAPGHGQRQLCAEHAEDEAHHEQAEAECAHEGRYRLVGRIFREQPVVHIASGAYVSAPPSSFPYAGHHGPYHADEGEQSHDGVPPPYDDVCYDDPVDVVSRCREVSVEVFHISTISPQRYEI